MPLDTILVDLINLQLMKQGCRADFTTPDGYHITGEVMRATIIDNRAVIRVARDTAEPIFFTHIASSFTPEQLEKLTLKLVGGVMTLVDV